MVQTVFDTSWRTVAQSPPCSVTADNQCVDTCNIRQHRNERPGETGDPRENPPTNGTVRHDSHVQKYGVTLPEIEPGSAWWEASRLTAQPRSAKDSILIRKIWAALSIVVLRANGPSAYHEGKRSLSAMRERDFRALATLWLRRLRKRVRSARLPAPIFTSNSVRATAFVNRFTQFACGAGDSRETPDLGFGASPQLKPGSHRRGNTVYVTQLAFQMCCNYLLSPNHRLIRQIPIRRLGFMGFSPYSGNTVLCDWLRGALKTGIVSDWLLLAAKDSLFAGPPEVKQCRYLQLTRQLTRHKPQAGPRWCSGQTTLHHLREPGSIPGGVLPRIFACGNRSRRCRWSVGSLRDLPFTPSLPHTHITSPPSSFKTSMLKAVKIPQLHKPQAGTSVNLQCPPTYQA
ncbi:hypothetical protein PR048_023179 [Dryococelus australis]|uniref:Uncharacterized protein n=1 Tax=Dryococelus australis TaxID=614101 RepID=A0ABQ9GTC6_9NEOP|nr:hypothetical protein PR048_023179 [Dryococelus australis]